MGATPRWGPPTMNKHHAAFIPAALLVLALASLPSGYYTFLRLVVTAWSLFYVWDEYQRGGSLNGWAVAFYPGGDPVQSLGAGALGPRKLALAGHRLRDPIPGIRRLSPSGQTKRLAGGWWENWWERLSPLSRKGGIPRI